MRGWWRGDPLDIKNCPGSMLRTAFEPVACAKLKFGFNPRRIAYPHHTVDLRKLCLDSYGRKLKVLICCSP